MHYSIIYALNGTAEAASWEKVWNMLVSWSTLLCTDTLSTVLMTRVSQSVSGPEQTYSSRIAHFTELPHGYIYTVHIAAPAALNDSTSKWPCFGYRGITKSSQRMTLSPSPAAVPVEQISKLWRNGSRKEQSKDSTVLLKSSVACVLSAGRRPKDTWEGGPCWYYRNRRLRSKEGDSGRVVECAQL